MNERETGSRMTSWETWQGPARVSTVTLGLLLSTYLQASAREAYSSGLARMGAAVDGMSSAAQDYEALELTSARRSLHRATYLVWLTQYATVTGFLLASGAKPRSWASIRQRVREIAHTSEVGRATDSDAFTTKVEKARAITRSVLGDGRFNRDTTSQTICNYCWQLDKTLSGTSPHSSKPGSLIEEYSHPGPLERPQSVIQGQRWIQMTLDDLPGSSVP